MHGIRIAAYGDGVPTATEFREVAGVLDDLQQRAAGANLAIVLNGDELGLEGGEVVPLILRGLGTAQVNLGQIAIDCATGSDEARRRAGVCDQYDLDLDTYDRDLERWNDRTDDDSSAMPVEPPRPASWADAG